MVKQRVLIPTHPSRVLLPTDLPVFQEFREQFDVSIEEFPDGKAFQEALTTKYKDISALWITVPVIRGFGGLKQHIEFFPKSLKVVGYPSVGANLFEPEALRERGIDLVNIGNASAKNVADIALSLTLSTFRFTNLFESKFREYRGDLTKARSIIGSTEYDPTSGEIIPHSNNDNWIEKLVISGYSLESPSGKVAGFVGLGAIGKEIAKRLNVIGLKIFYTKTTPLTEEEQSSLAFETTFFKTFEELIPHVDLIVLAVPHTSKTINLINEKTLKLVKQGVRIVNIGRGTAIDEDALFKALDDRTITAIGLDVFQNEPHIDERFFNRPNVTLLPHIGAFTVDNFKDSAIRSLENISKVLSGKGNEADIAN